MPAFDVLDRKGRAPVRTALDLSLVVSDIDLTRFPQQGLTGLYLLWCGSCSPRARKRQLHHDHGQIGFC